MAVARLNFIVVARALTLGCASLSCAFIPALSFAQNSETDSRTTDETLPTLSIEADSSAPVGSVEHGDFAGRYTRIEGESLGRDDTELSDVLAFESGIQQLKIGGFGSFSAVSIRASTPSQTGIFLDGIRINGEANAIVDLATFDPASLENIDVYRGAAPLQLGATNLGGGVNLNTLAQGPNITRATFSIGSFRTLQTNIAHQSTHNRWHAIAAFNAGNSENSFTFDNDNATPLNPSDDAIEPRNNADVSSVSLLTKLAYRHSEKTTSDLLFQQANKTSGVPEWRNAEVNEASYQDGQGQLHASHRTSNLDGWSTRHTAFIHWNDDHYDDRLGQVGLGQQNFRSQQRIFGASTYWDQFTDSGKWAMTAEFRRDLYDSTDDLGVTRTVEANRSTYSGGFAYTHFANQDRLIITPRIRLENHRRDWSSNQSDTSPEDQGTIINPEISVRFDQKPTLSWTSSIGRYYRVPTFAEMFGTQGLMVGNDELNPEQGINAELSVQWQARKDVKLIATLFHSARDDLIAPIYDAQGIGRHVNIGKARISGVELESSWSPASQINLRANITAQEALNLSDVTLFYNKQLPGQAAVTAYLRSDVKISRNLKAWAEVHSLTSRFYDRGNLLKAPDSITSNVGTRWERKNLGLQFTVSNITDKNIEDFNGFPRPGRAVHLGLSLKF